ncbi:hypothetical protein ACG04R_07385 [Roseateles sp. BYS78W]|uniref:DUF1795 domain-containing protein n=1 Tax=Pelomonas candidula TaxID=3299025 RepID=A0ABW7H996_9BURK
MALFSYTFPLTSPPAPGRHGYDAAEFQLDLSPAWRQVLVDEGNALHFESLDDGAALIVSVDLVGTPVDEAQSVAEHCVAKRIDAHRLASATPLEVIQQRIQPHASGAALEMSYAAATGEHIHLYLGYVTRRKVLSFSMACPPDRRAAMTLFNATVPHFKPRLP